MYVKDFIQMIAPYPNRVIKFVPSTSLGGETEDLDVVSTEDPDMEESPDTLYVYLE